MNSDYIFIDEIIDKARSLGVTMSDPWRNDFIDDGQAADEQRYEFAIDDLMASKNCNLDRFEIEGLFDQYYH